MTDLDLSYPGQFPPAQIHHCQPRTHKHNRIATTPVNCCLWPIAAAILGRKLLHILGPAPPPHPNLLQNQYPWMPVVTPQYSGEAKQSLTPSSHAVKTGCFKACQFAPMAQQIVSAGSAFIWPCVDRKTLTSIFTSYSSGQHPLTHCSSAFSSTILGTSRLAPTLTLRTAAPSTRPVLLHVCHKCAEVPGGRRIGDLRDDESCDGPSRSLRKAMTGAS